MCGLLSIPPRRVEATDLIPGGECLSRGRHSLPDKNLALNVLVYGAPSRGAAGMRPGERPRTRRMLPVFSATAGGALPAACEAATAGSGRQTQNGISSSGMPAAAASAFCVGVRLAGRLAAAPGSAACSDGSNPPTFTNSRPLLPTLW